MINSAASRLILEPFSEKAVTQAAHSAMEEVGGKVTIGFVFASSDYQSSLPDFLEVLQLQGHIPNLVGCSGSGLVGVDREAEEVSGFSLLLLHLPETTVHIRQLHREDVEKIEDPKEWRRLTGLAPEEVDSWLALADPYGFPVESWLSRWNQAYPRIPAVGGLASGGGEHKRDDVFVFHNRQVLPPGSAVLVGLKNGVIMRPVLSQGCRPIGEPLPITGSNANLVTAIGGKPAYAALAEAFETLDEDDKMRAQGNLFAGLASMFIHKISK